MNPEWRQLPGVQLLRRSSRAIKRGKYRIWDARRYDGRLRIYLTLECNLSCPYCVNQHNPAESRASTYVLRGGDEWIRVINRIGRPVIFTGGEPSLHPAFLAILNGIRPDIDVTVFTNFSFDPDEYLLQVRRPITFFGTYHPMSGPPDSFLKTVNRLRERGAFRGHIHVVDWDKHRRHLDRTRQAFLQAGWDPVRDRDQYTIGDSAAMKYRQSVNCSREIILIAPDGARYLCVSKLLRKSDPLENIFKEPLREGAISHLCHDYGFCAPCDAVGITPMGIDRREAVDHLCSREREKACSDSSSSS